MDWKFNKETNRLTIYGENSLQDIRKAKKLMAEGKIPANLDAIIYQKNESSSVVMFIRGEHLSQLLKPETEDSVINPNRPNLKQILNEINEANTRQSTYAGMLLFATNSKRFLLFTPRARNNKVFLLGDHPKKGETPAQTVCRVALADADVEIAENCLTPLVPIEHEGTTYYSYLVLSKCEFKPALSDRLIAAHWKSFEALEELALHPSVAALFERDPKLQRLTQPIEVNFDDLIDQILHSDPE
jgi:hypothetical protein